MVIAEGARIKHEHLVSLAPRPILYVPNRYKEKLTGVDIGRHFVETHQFIQMEITKLDEAMTGAQ